VEWKRITKDMSGSSLGEEGGKKQRGGKKKNEKGELTDWGKRAVSRGEVPLSHTMGVEASGGKKKKSFGSGTGSSLLEEEIKKATSATTAGRGRGNEEKLRFRVNGS